MPHFLHELRQACDAYASRPALVYQGQTLTYGDLEARATRCAAWLQGLGVAPGDRVALFTRRQAAVSGGSLGRTVCRRRAAAAQSAVHARGDALLPDRQPAARRRRRAGAAGAAGGTGRRVAAAADGRARCWRRSIRRCRRSRAAACLGCRRPVPDSLQLGHDRLAEGRGPYACQRGQQPGGAGRVLAADARRRGRQRAAAVSHSRPGVRHAR